LLEKKRFVDSSSLILAATGSVGMTAISCAFYSGAASVVAGAVDGAAAVALGTTGLRLSTTSAGVSGLTSAVSGSGMAAAMTSRPSGAARTVVAVDSTTVRAVLINR
jgi:hypothetical protein